MLIEESENADAFAVILRPATSADAQPADLSSHLASPEMCLLCFAPIATGERQLMRHDVLEQVLASPRLPMLPAVAIQILDLTTGSHVNLKAVAELIRNDQALSAKVLRTVNSSYYGLKAPCGTIRQAIVYLGVNTVKTLVLGFSLVDVVSRAGKRNRSFDYVSYWRRALHSATAASEIARRIGNGNVDPEAAFLGALMQDIGMVALLQALDDRYASLVSDAGADHDQLVALERAALGTDHAEVAGRIADCWKLPVHLQQAIRWHHDADSADEEHAALARIVEVARIAAAALDDDAAACNRLHEAARRHFGLVRQEIESVLMIVAKQCQQLAPLLGVDIGEEIDLDALLIRADEQFTAHQAAVARQTEMMRQTNEYLAVQAMCDALTKVANRRSFDRQLEQHFKQAMAWGYCLGLVFVDIDHFKHINDTYGHQAGDHVLCEIARRMCEHVGAAGDVFRYGGEEFAILLPNADRVQATRIAEQIRRVIEGQPVQCSDLTGKTIMLSITMSFGVASVDPKARGVLSTPETLVHVADQALYAAKTAGRNCVRVFTALSTPVNQVA